MGKQMGLMLATESIISDFFIDNMLRSHLLLNCTSLASFTKAMSLYKLENRSYMKTCSTPMSSTGGAHVYFPCIVRQSSAVLIWCSPRRTDILSGK